MRLQVTKAATPRILPHCLAVFTLDNATALALQLVPSFCTASVPCLLCSALLPGPLPAAPLAPP